MRRPWTVKEVEHLRKTYADTTTEHIARRLGRSVSSVYGKASDLGLNKSDAFLKSGKSGRIKDGSLGVRSQFQKGQKPWNAGKSFNAGGRSVETRFKPGRSPEDASNYQPIGSFRITKDGILEQKVNDDNPVPARRWVAYQRIVWESVNGPIPENHVVVFKPGHKTTDPERITIDVLECISRVENMRRNTIHRYPPELKDAMKLAGKLRRKIREKSN